jgi:predicted helicase
LRAATHPTTNIVYEDSSAAVLYQDNREVARARFEDSEELDRLLYQFFEYESPSIAKFRLAIERFKEDLPEVLAELRRVIEQESQTNEEFTAARDRLLELVRNAINPHLGPDDVREMLIQHILTEDIFSSVFNEPHYHHENNIAQELESVTSTFYTGQLRRNTLLKIDPYYSVIRSAAMNISDHHEKQRFLKVVYENFYRTYNPAGADRLGIVYTPNEIVQFMVQAAEHLTHKNFGRFLGDEKVNILDPATGTGTFVTEIIEHIPRQKLEYKYLHEVYCNEVALLPYYTANLNIEFSYRQKMGAYLEFRNISLVDTLDNLNYVGSKGQFSMFELTAENLERIKRQNEKEISVIIGNPPYNANQLNENENNKNRPYPWVDKRIKNTYVAASAATKTKAYDMYSRFIRWASDRIGDNGVIAFIVNRSCVAKWTFDGFRKVVAEEFNSIYVVDLGGDVRDNPSLSGTVHNVFGIQTGVAILFLVRTGEPGPADIYYVRRPEDETAKEKLRALGSSKFEELPFDHIIPDEAHDWIDQATEVWDNLLPVATKQTKAAKYQWEHDAIFKFFSVGVSTNRDEWVYDHSQETLEEKARYFIETYNSDAQRLSHVDIEELDDRLDYSISGVAT